MKMRTNGASLAARAAALSLVCALVAGCSSGNVNRFLPGSATSNAVRGLEPAGRRHVRTLVRMRIPRLHRGERRPVHPASISPLTQSVSIGVNGAAPTLFEATVTSSNCTVTTAGRLCTFAITAPSGTDTFAVTTYSAPGGGGTALDYALATVPIAKGKANQVAITLGPVVTTTADSGMGSLRYALGSANNGDTVMFLLPAGSTITVASSMELLGRTVAIAGPGASNLALSGGGSQQLFINRGTLTISGLTLTGGNASASYPGGTIFNGGSLTLANDVLGNSTSSVAMRRSPQSDLRLRSHRGLHPHCTTTFPKGGAVYNNGALVVSGTTFNGNVVYSNVASCIEGEGGAIFNDIAGTMSSTGDTYSNNSAFGGGAVFNASALPVSFTNDAFSGNSGCTASSGCLTSGCTGSGCSNFAEGTGAAIYDAPGSSGITVTSSTFTNNVAGGPTNDSLGDGGALALLGGLPVITGSTFTGNVAGGGNADCSAGEGGAIYAAGPLELDDDAFDNNQASGDQMSGGGAVYDPGSLHGTGDSFTGNAATGLGSTCATTASGAGGAVIAATSGSDIATIANSTFANNSATGSYGAVGGAFACGTCIVANDTFTSNAALGTGANGAVATNAIGGALFAVTLAKVTGSTFRSNAATIESAVANQALGGAMASGAALTSANDTFTSNVVSGSGGTGAVVAGGVFALTGSGTFTSTGDTYSSNTATDVGGSGAVGGAMYITGPYAIANATFSGNQAIGQEGVGGALTVTGTGSTITNVTFSGNTATATGGASALGAGGAIFDGGGASISGGKIVQNTASTTGGAIAQTTNAEQLSGVTVSGNTVTNDSTSTEGGGAIFDGGGLIIVNSTVANNSVTVSGSGLGGGGIFNSGGLIAEGVTISGNSVLGTVPSPHGGGGGILSDQSLTMLNATVSNNSSKGDAGGILIDNGAGTAFDNVTVFQNAAAGFGGNLDLTPSSTATMTQSVVAGGSAATGADVDNAGTLSSGDYNIVQTAVAGTPMTGTLTHNQMVDPQLLPLANNGGQTFTNADQAHSPGTGFIPFSGSICGAISLFDDQRGYLRGAGGVCDVGAYEFAGVATAARHRHPLPKANFRQTRAMRLRMPRLPQIKPLKIRLPE